MPTATATILYEVSFREVSPLIFRGEDIENLFQLWLSGALDGMTPAYGVCAGVRNLERVGKGWTPTPLLKRYTSSDIESVLSEMAENGLALYASLLLEVYWRQTPIADLARSLNAVSASVVQDWFLAARNEFVQRLLKQ